MKAWIDNQKGVGYVVMVTEDRNTRPLRNFGQMQSAAIEFRNWVNNCTDERLPRWLNGYTDTYNPEDKYTYPEFREKAERPNLRKQKYE